MGKTSIPSQVVEYSSKGAGGVREYKLSPEELEEVRQKYPATKRDKSFVKPIVQNTPVKGENRMGKFTMTEAEFKVARADGKTIAQIAQEQDVAEATIYKHMNKWAETPKETQLLREKEAQPGPITELEQLDKALQEIEELKAALSATQPISHDMLNEYKAEAEHWKAQATEAVALAGKAAEESMAKIERLKERGREAVDSRNAAEVELVKVTDECNILRDQLEQSGWQLNAAEKEISCLTAMHNDAVTARGEYQRLYEEQYEFAQEYFKQNELLKARADGAVAAHEAAELDLEQATKDFNEQGTALKAEILSLINKVENIRAQAEQENDVLSERLSNAEMERDVLQAELNRMITERDELQAERDAMLIHIEETEFKPEPASEVHLLDRSIADLTRARWILDRLSASSE